MNKVITAIRRVVVHRSLAGSVALAEGAVAGWEEHPRTSPRFTRWTVVLALAIASVAATVMAQENDTLTISSTFYMDWLDGTVGSDLAKVYTNGHAHTWTLTLHGTTHSHERFDSFGVSNWVTEIHATSFDLEFSGPDAATLNGIVSDHIAGGDVLIYLRNAYWEFGHFAMMYVWPMGSDVEFFSGHDTIGSDTLFPSDAEGNPVVGPEPFSIWSEHSLLSDRRSGNDGDIESGASLVTFEGMPVVPRLTITSSNKVVIVSWPSPSAGFSLQQNNQLNTTNWATLTETVTDTGTIKFITVDPSVGNRFYRLFKP